MGVTNSSLTGNTNSQTNNTILKGDVSVPITNLYTAKMKGKSGTEYNLIYVKGREWMWFIKYNSETSDSYTLFGAKTVTPLDGYYAGKIKTKNGIIGKEHVK